MHLCSTLPQPIITTLSRDLGACVPGSKEDGDGVHWPYGTAGSLDITVFTQQNWQGISQDVAKAGVAAGNATAVDGVGEYAIASATAKQATAFFANRVLVLTFEGAMDQLHPTDEQLAALLREAVKTLEAS